MDKRGKRLIWFSEIRWDYLVTRKQHILSRFPDDWRILFIEPIVIGENPHLFPVRRGKVVVVSVPYIRGSKNRFLVRMLNIGLVRAVVSAIGETILRFWLFVLGFSGKDRVIGLSSIHWGRFASKMKAKIKFYDCNDDHLKFAEDTVWGREYLKRYLHSVDFVTYVSPELNEMVQGLCKVESYFIGNGVDYEHFARKREVPEELSDFKKPIIGYAGAMDWVDVELLGEIARRYKDWSIVLIGPELRKGIVSSKIKERGFSNVFYLGKVDYSILPAFVQSFDVAIIPFVRDRIASSLNPNKLYEYLAVGIPVVTMNYSASLVNLRGLIWVASSYSEFVDSIGLAIKDNRIAERKAFARNHDWSEKARELLSIIEEKYRVLK